MKQITFNLPENATINKGAPFWSPPKIFPRLVEFTSHDTNHMSLIIVGLILRAMAFPPD